MTNSISLRKQEAGLYSVLLNGYTTSLRIVQTNTIADFGISTWALYDTKRDHIRIGTGSFKQVREDAKNLLLSGRFESPESIEAQDKYLLATATAWGSDIKTILQWAKF